MSTKSDPSQGTVPDPARPRGHKVPDPDATAIFNSIQRGVNASERANTKPRLSQKVGGKKQDWRTG
jgi:hypothetical protein